MTTTPAQRIEAAIVRLKTERMNASAGVWLGWQEYSPLSGKSYGMETLTFDEPVNIARAMTRADALLVEMMHRTIDAQIAILHDTLNLFRDPIPMFAGREEQICAAQLALVDAILTGGTE